MEKTTFRGSILVGIQQAGLTIVKMLVTGLVMALLAGAFVKLKLGGAQ